MSASTCDRCLEGRHVRCSAKTSCACSCRIERSASPAASTPRPDRSLKVARPTRAAAARRARASTPRARQPRPQRLKTCRGLGCANLLVASGARAYCTAECRPDPHRWNTGRPPGGRQKLDGLTPEQRRTRRKRLRRAGGVDLAVVIPELVADPSGRTWSRDARIAFRAECERVAERVHG